MLSLVPGYTVVSWTLRLPAVGVRDTCGVEGRPGGGGGGAGKGRYKHKQVQGSADINSKAESFQEVQLSTPAHQGEV